SWSLMPRSWGPMNQVTGSGEQWRCPRRCWLGDQRVDYCAHRNISPRGTVRVTQRTSRRTPCQRTVLTGNVRAVRRFCFQRRRGAGALRGAAVLREFSLPALYEVPADGNLTDIIRRNAAQHPDVAVIARKAGGSWQDVTATTFLAEVLSAAKGLIAAGVQPGD